jgi:hypothetical protein
MEVEPKDFVHVLLFMCPNCGLPVPHAVTTRSKDLEQVDLDYHNIACACGWSGGPSGLEARRHWVESWRDRSAPDLRPGQPSTP